MTDQKPFLKYALFALAGLLLLSAGAAGGFWYGTKSEKPSVLPAGRKLETQNPTPTESPVSAPTPTTEPAITEQPSVTPKSNWKRFTNTKFGYHFDYPNN